MAGIPKTPNCAFDSKAVIGARVPGPVTSTTTEAKMLELKDTTAPPFTLVLFPD